MRPKYGIPELLLEAACLLVLGASVYYCYTVIPGLPARIATHYSRFDVPDGYGSRNTLWIFPLIAACIYVLFSVLPRFPRLYNLPVKVDTPVKFRFMFRMMALFKLALVAFFSVLPVDMAANAADGSPAMTLYALLVLLPLVYGIIIYSIYRLGRMDSGER